MARPAAGRGGAARLTIVLATLIGLAAYVVVGAVLRIYHRRHPRVAERAARKKRRRREAREPRTEGL